MRVEDVPSDPFQLDTEGTFRLREANGQVRFGGLFPDWVHVAHHRVYERFQCQGLRGLKSYGDRSPRSGCCLHSLRHDGCHPPGCVIWDEWPLLLSLVMPWLQVSTPAKDSTFFVFFGGFGLSFQVEQSQGDTVLTRVSLRTLSLTRMSRGPLCPHTVARQAHRDEQGFVAGIPGRRGNPLNDVVTEACRHGVLQLVPCLIDTVSYDSEVVSCYS